MRSFLYISPSVIPSSSANAVHVIHQCAALEQLGFHPTLVFKRSTKSLSLLCSSILSAYGVNVNAWQLVSYYSKLPFAYNFLIGILSLRFIFSRSRFDFILSRNLYASFFLVIFRRKLLFETHQLEYGIRGIIQKYILVSSFSKSILISNSQVDCLQVHHRILLRDFIVLHDAAPSGLNPYPSISREKFLVDCHVYSYVPKKFQLLCGYFGQLSAGRGIEVLHSIAKQRPNFYFVIFGGTSSEIDYYRSFSLPNIFYAGTCSHSSALAYQRCFDVLLMPYQESVSIGVKNHDTAKWMSPMKMFEYMSSGVPIISSDLPVLREILSHRSNSLLCSPTNTSEWISALDELIVDNDLAASISRRAYYDYSNLHTWSKRAKAIVTFSD